MKKLVTIGAALSLVAGALPAFAAGNVTVTTSDSASLTNNIMAVSSTGGNTATGSSLSADISGSNVHDSGGANTGGNGGNTMSGGAGGLIQTGNASAESDVSNTLNSADIGVTGTPWAMDAITVSLGRLATLTNTIGASATSDGNAAGGSMAAVTISAGNLDASGGSNKLGNGGNMISGGNGGAIATGNASSLSHIVNILNSTITRIQK